MVQDRFGADKITHYRIFIPKSLASPLGHKNRLSIQKILETHKENVICCMNGHNHIDYIDINSSSYQWIGETRNDRFQKEEYERYMSLPKLAGYKDSLFAFTTLDPKSFLLIEGVGSQ